MGLYEHFPYTNYHDVNIDWVLETTKRMEKLADDIDTEIAAEVDAQLQEMIDDGTLGDLINNTLLANINNKVDDVKADVDAITPLDAAPTDGSTKGVTSDGVYDAIKSVSDDLDDLQTAVNDDISDLQDDIAAVDAKFFISPGKNILCIGDSWTVGTGATIPATQRFTTLLAQSLQMTELNYGVGASGFTRPNTFMDQLVTANAALSADDKKNTGIVLITGGVNDVRHMEDTSQAAFTTAIADCVTYALANFPYSQLVMAVGTSENVNFYNSQKAWYSAAMMTLRNLHIGGRMLVIDHVAAAINGRGDTYASDNLHPNTLGHSTLAGFLYNAIQGGSCDSDYYYGTFVWDDAYIYPVNSPHIFRQTENVLFNEGIIRAEQNISGSTKVGTYTGPMGRFNLYTQLYRGNLPVATFCVTASGSVYVIPNSGTISSSWELRLAPTVVIFNNYVEGT